MMKTQFLIVDDHPMVRAGLISMLKNHFPHTKFFEAETIKEARAILDLTKIDCALLDYKIGREHAISLIPDIVHYHPEVRILVISMMDPREVGVASIRAGAHGFLSKAAHPDELLQAIRTVMDNRVYASIELSRSLVREKDISPLDKLSKREIEVFSLIGEGLKTGQIAAQLGVSVKTVEAHRQHIKDKLGIESAVQLTIQASKWLDLQ